MNPKRDGINSTAKPTGTGCVECLATGGWLCIEPTHKAITIMIDIIQSYKRGFILVT